MDFQVLDCNGQVINCEIVDLIADKLNKVNYILYSDGTKNNDGKFEIYASRYIKKENQFLLEDIQKDSEWDFIDAYLVSKNSN